MTIRWKAVEQYFYSGAVCFSILPILKFWKIINFGFDTVNSERVKDPQLSVSDSTIVLFIILSDMRQVLTDQLKCFDSKTDGKLLFLADLQEFYRRLSEIELDYSRNLERLSKMYWDKLQRHKSQRYKLRVFTTIHDSRHFTIW